MRNIKNTDTTRVRDLFSYNFFFDEKKTMMNKYNLKKEFIKNYNKDISISDFTKIIKETNKEILNQLTENPNGVLIHHNFPVIKLILVEATKKELRNEFKYIRKYLIDSKYYPAIILGGLKRYNNIMNQWNMILHERNIRTVSDKLRDINYYDFKIVYKK